jgi:hypothetical protein
MSAHIELGWSVVEMLGHRVIAGFVSEVEIAGAGFLRVDLWAEEGTPRATQFVAPASVYAITPSTEEAVRERMKPRPVHRIALAASNDEFSDWHDAEEGGDE